MGTPPPSPPRLTDPLQGPSPDIAADALSPFAESGAPASGRSPWTALEGMRFQALAAVALKGGAAACALLLQWLVARVYGPEGTGLFALMSTTAVFIGVLAVAGQDLIVLRNVAGDLAEGKAASARAHANASIRIAATGTMLGTAVLILVAFAYGAGLESAAMPMLLLALPVVAGLSMGRVFAFIARAGGRPIASQLPDGPITSLMSGTLLALGLLAFGVLPTWTLGAIYGTAYIAALAFSAWLYRRVRRDWPKADAPVALRPIVLAGLPMMVGSAMPYLSDWLVIVTTTALLSPEAAGQIRMVSLFLAVMYVVTIALDSVLSPALAGAIRLGETSRVRRLYRNYILLALALNIPMIVLGFGFPTLFLGLFGPEFVAIAPALRIAVVLQTLSILLGPAGIVLVMAHRERLTLLVNAVGLIALVVGCALIIPAYGIMGAGLIGAAVLLIKRITEVLLVRRLIWRSP